MFLDPESDLGNHSKSKDSISLFEMEKNTFVHHKSLKFSSAVLSSISYLTQDTNSS